MYKIYLGKTLFPIAPESIDIKIKNQNEQLSLVNGGELSILKAPGLTEFSMKLMLPSRKYHFAVYEGGFKEPRYYLNILEKLKTDKKIFDLSVIRTAKEKSKYISTLATVESYTIQEAAEDLGDLYVDLSCKQYIHYGTKVVTIKKNNASSGGTRPPSTANKGKSYVIKQGDTLPGIARRFYGKESKYWDIYKANKKQLDSIAVSRGFPRESGHWWIFPGTKITLP